MLKYTRYSYLVKQYKNDIYSYSLYMLKNEMDAEDVTQDILIRIWQNMGKFNLNSAKSWIIKSTHNLCIDQIRKRKVKAYREYSIDEDIEETLMDTENKNNPLIKTHVKMMAAKVKETIKKLPDNLRSVFVLYEVHGMKYKEISKILGMPLNSVKVYLLRARKKLQEDLKNYEVKEVL
ncbi:RNA polymerase sigma factor [Bacteroidota bacterium]